MKQLIIILFTLSARFVWADLLPQDQYIIFNNLPSSRGNIVKTETIKLELLTTKLIEEDYFSLQKRKLQITNKLIARFRYLDGLKHLSVIEKLLIGLTNPVEIHTSKVLNNSVRLALLYRTFILYYLYFLKKNYRIRKSIKIEIKAVTEEFNLFYETRKIDTILNLIKIKAVMSYLRHSLKTNYLEIMDVIPALWVNQFQKVIINNSKLNQEVLLKESIPIIQDSFREVKNKKYDRYLYIHIMLIVAKMNWLNLKKSFNKIKQFFKVHPLNITIKKSDYILSNNLESK